MPDAYYWKNRVAGAQRRIGAAVPDVNHKTLRSLRDFVRNWCRANLRPLTPDEVPSFDEWLEHTDYPEWRREELRQANEKLFQKRHLNVKSFIKTETYEASDLAPNGDSVFKAPRLINSRSDKFKCMIGPYTHAIEQQLFRTKYFIKYVPVNERPQWIMDRLNAPGFKFVGTDFSMFESSFAPELLRAVELQMYAYMLRGVPNGSQVVSWLVKAMTHVNRCKFSDGTSYTVTGTRMSGEMCTSLGNGFTNLMVSLFLASRHMPLGDVDGFVEGDDGLFRMKGSVPTAAEYADLGFSIKMAVSDNLGEAGFCKQYFHEDVMVNLVDPVCLMVKFGWSHSMLRFSGAATQHGLLRAKADSLLYQCAGAPVAQELALYAKRCVGDGPKYFSGVRGRPAYNEANVVGTAKNIDLRSRHVVAKLFGLSVDDQLSVESYLRGLKTLQPLHHPAIDDLVKKSWTDYYNRYVRTYVIGEFPDY